MLTFLDGPSKEAAKLFDLKIVEEKFGELRHYRSAFKEWACLLDLMQTTEQRVREKGLYQGAAAELNEELTVNLPSPHAIRIRKEIIEHVR